MPAEPAVLEALKQGAPDQDLDLAVQVRPSTAVQRRAVKWQGMSAEIVQAVRHERLEIHFAASRHLLALCEQGQRSDGDTFVEGLPRSRLRDVARKLTFVPAGHAYREWHEPRVLPRITYFYFDPDWMPSPAHQEVCSASLLPRLFFENEALCGTALKLTRLIESADTSPYLEALGTVMAHELLRLGACDTDLPIKGGLALWQRRKVIAYIEAHLAEPISLDTLARLVGLSPHYFCRAFRQSLGMPPRRYHNSRRIECARTLLAMPERSVTDVGLSVGYRETSSFTTAFRKLTGETPTSYRRAHA